MEGKKGSRVKYLTGTGAGDWEPGTVVAVGEGTERHVASIGSDGVLQLRKDVPRGTEGGHYWDVWPEDLD